MTFRISRRQRAWLTLLREYASPVVGETDVPAVARALGRSEGEVLRGLRDLRELGFWNGDAVVTAGRRAA